MEAAHSSGPTLGSWRIPFSFFSSGPPNWRGESGAGGSDVPATNLSVAAPHQTRSDQYRCQRMLADINNLPNSLNGDFRMAVFPARGRSSGRRRRGEKPQIKA